MRDRGGRCGVASAAAVLCAVSGCSGPSPSVLDPRGPAAAEVTDLWWVMLAISGVVTAFVLGMMTWGIVKGRRRREEELEREVPWGDGFILIAGLGVTTVILVGMFMWSLRTMGVLAREVPESLEVEVIGHDWWWEARYPNGAITANEIHIPAGERVKIKLRTADVIHSFWVPQLAPKIDMIPGRENEMWLEADEPGRYRGQCAEFCGLQHAHMIFFVVADEPAAFREWVRNMADPAPEPTDPLAERGRLVFLSSTCAGCHTIRGTPADGELGPDLTHLATRETIAAGTLELTPANLAHWIADPQDVKPGVTMPPTDLNETELRALVAYLMTLGFEEDD